MGEGQHLAKQQKKGHHLATQKKNKGHHLAKQKRK